MPDGVISVVDLNGATAVDIPLTGYGDTGRANTFYFWGNFAGASVTIQAAPARLNILNDITSKEWFDVRRSDGSSATFTSKGTMNVVGRAAYYRLLISGLAAETNIIWEVR